MFKLVLEKAEEPETKLPTSTGSSQSGDPCREQDAQEGNSAWSAASRLAGRSWFKKHSLGARWDVVCLFSGHCWTSPPRRLKPDSPAKGSCLMEEGISHSRVTRKGQKLRYDAKDRGGLTQHGAPGRPPNSMEEGTGSDTTRSRKKQDSNG